MRCLTSNCCNVQWKKLWLQLLIISILWLCCLLIVFFLLFYKLRIHKLSGNNKKLAQSPRLCLQMDSFLTNSPKILYFQWYKSRKKLTQAHCSIYELPARPLIRWLNCQCHFSSHYHRGHTCRLLADVAAVLTSKDYVSTSGWKASQTTSRVGLRSDSDFFAFFFRLESYLIPPQVNGVMHCRQARH